MARPHSLMVWSVVFGFLAAASLFAAEAKEPKQKRAKAPAAKSTQHRSDDPFAGPEKHAVPSAKKRPKPVVRELRPSENVARIEAELAKTTELNFVETPLQEVVDYLKSHHDIEILIDNKELQDVGIGTDSPVTVSLKGISLRSALNLMLNELSLTWTIQDEVLLITTPEEGDQRLSTKVYDVADLVVCRDEHDAPWEDYDTLIDVITPTIQPITRDEVGGPGSISGATLGTAKVLIVSQTREVHEQIADLLAKIREIAKKNPDAGTPRRNKPVSPTPRKHSADMGGLSCPPVSADPLASPNAKASSDARPPKQEKQSPKPEAPKGRPSM